ncbi:MAG: UPF0058 family protein [Methanomicrobiales archaeon]|jgi:hypothetical protein|nr:UPF0058 family protein [Methanomicrobiales archaeon]
MSKAELIKLHQMLSDVKDYLESINPKLKFSQYNALKITASQRYRSKTEHKYAIFVLGMEIADAMKNKDNMPPKGMSSRMKELADKSMIEMNRRY